VVQWSNGERVPAAGIWAKFFYKTVNPVRSDALICKSDQAARRPSGRKPRGMSSGPGSSGRRVIRATRSWGFTRRQGVDLRADSRGFFRSAR